MQAEKANKLGAARGAGDGMVSHGEAAEAALPGLPSSPETSSACFLAPRGTKRQGTHQVRKIEKEAAGGNCGGRRVSTRRCRR